MMQDSLPDNGIYYITKRKKNDASSSLIYSEKEKCIFEEILLQYNPFNYILKNPSSVSK